MRKYKVFILVSILLIAVIVAGYSKKTIGMNFSASDVERLEVHYMQYADGEASPEYEKKVITDFKDIEDVISSLQALQIGKDVSKEKPTYDRPVLTFRYLLKDGTSYVLIYQRWMQGGGFVRTSSLFNNVTGDDSLLDLWGKLSYDIEPSSELEILFTE